MSATRKLAIAVVIGLAGTASAMATDLYVAPAEAPYVEESNADWYFGFHKGYGWGLSDHQPLGGGPPGFPDGHDFTMTGFLAGIQVGVLFPSNSALRFGLEKDIEWTNISGSCESPDCGAFADPYYGSINWEGSKRARLGFMMQDGNVMPYLTGGLAFANVTRGSDDGEETLNVFGWTAGGGIEVFTDSNVSFFGEARYTAYGAREFDTGGIPPNVAFSKTTIRAGINWHIN